MNKKTDKNTNQNSNGTKNSKSNKNSSKQKPCDPNNIKCFFALPIPESLQENLQEHCSNLSNIHPGLANSLAWTPEENWHLTIFFIGDIDKNKLSDLQKAGENASKKSETLELNLSRIAGLPQQKPRAWVIHTQLNMQLAKLHAALKTSLSQFNIDAKTRTFMPHITIARCEQPLFPQPANGAGEIDTLNLYQSIEKDGKRAYKILDSWKLSK